MSENELLDIIFDSFKNKGKFFLFFNEGIEVQILYKLIHDKDKNYLEKIQDENHVLS